MAVFLNHFPQESLSCCRFSLFLLQHTWPTPKNLQTSSDHYSAVIWFQSKSSLYILQHKYVSLCLYSREKGHCVVLLLYDKDQKK